MTADPALEERAINVIRGLAMDAPQAANSGHPGTAMALAPLAHVLWTRIMTYDADAPHWPDRDRFVLSAGHASILLYSMLHLTGYGLTLDDIKAFRQWGSATPGHPEVHHTAGVEVTTGPLGQGIGNAVGLAMAERMLRSPVRRRGVRPPHLRDLQRRRPDGGRQPRGRLARRPPGPRPPHRRLRRQPHHDRRRHGAGLLRRRRQALRGLWLARRGPGRGRQRPRRPRGRPPPCPAGARTGPRCWCCAATSATRRPSSPTPRRRTAARSATTRSGSPRRSWASRPTRRSTCPTTCSPTTARPGGPVAPPTRGGTSGSPTTRATARCSRPCLERRRPARLGRGAARRGRPARRSPPARRAAPASRRWPRRCPASSAAAATSPATPAPSSTPRSSRRRRPAGRQIHYGIREHGMGAAMNGMALHGGVIPVGGTFFVFSDYMRPSVRLAAVSEAKVVYSWTHDSVGLGEDGPTHQPIEQLAAMRAMPGLRLDPPGRRQRGGPGLEGRPHQQRPHRARSSPGRTWRCSRAPPVRRSTGAPTSSSTDGEPDIVLIGTGSEVGVCVGAAAQLRDAGMTARVVSMPSWDLFEAQPDAVPDIRPAARGADPRGRGGGRASAGTAGPTTASASTASAHPLPEGWRWPSSGTRPRTWRIAPGS